MKVLSVDGDTLAQQAHRDALSELGLSIRPVDSGVEAIGSVHEERPDLIVLGSQLRDVPGWQAAVWLRSVPALKEVPIILLGAEFAADAELRSARLIVLLPSQVSARSLRKAVVAALNSRLKAGTGGAPASEVGVAADKA